MLPETRIPPDARLVAAISDFENHLSLPQKKVFYQVTEAPKYFDAMRLTALVGRIPEVRRWCLGPYITNLAIATQQFATLESCEAGVWRVWPVIRTTILVCVFQNF